MPTRKKQRGAVHPHQGEKKSVTTAAKIKRTLKRAAHGTMLAAGLTVARWSVDVDALEPKLFSPSVLDRLKVPITRFHD